MPSAASWSACSRRGMQSHGTAGNVPRRIAIGVALLYIITAVAVVGPCAHTEQARGHTSAAVRGRLRIFPRTARPEAVAGVVDFSGAGLKRRPVLLRHLADLRAASVAPAVHRQRLEAVVAHGAPGHGAPGRASGGLAPVLPRGVHLLLG